MNARASVLRIWRKPSSLSVQTIQSLLVAALVLFAGLTLATLPLAWAVGLTLAAGALLLILLRPVVGLYLLVLAVPFGSLREIGFGVLSIGGAEAVAVLTAAAWLAGMLARREVRSQGAPLIVPLGILLAALSFSVQGALSLAWSIKGLLVWLELVAVYLLVVNLLEEKQARILVMLILVAGGLQALLGIYQFFGRVGPEGFVLFERFMRAYGTFQQPNPYGGYLALILPLSLTLVMTREPLRDRRALLTTLLAAAGLLLMGAALVMSWSRGAWLAFISALGVVVLVGAYCRAFSESKAGLLAGLVGGMLTACWLNRPGLEVVPALVLAVLAGVGVGAVVFVSLHRRWPWLLAGVAVLLVAMLVALGGQSLLPGSIAQRFSDFLPYVQPSDVTGVHVTDENFAVVERLAHWQAAQGMLSDHPLLGVGVGNYVPVYPAYALPGWKDPLGHAHNYYLNMAAEAGLLGLGAYALFLAACFQQGWSATRSVTGWQQSVTLGVLGVLTAFAVHSLFDDLYVHGLNMHLAMALGLLSVVTRRGEGPLVEDT